MSASKAFAIRSDDREERVLLGGIGRVLAAALAMAALALALPALSQTISTVAGGGVGDGGAAASAGLNDPTGVALDASGNLYIADDGNHRIRKRDAATGIITTVAGNGSATFAGDGGAAMAASLNHPHGVALDASGNLYIADQSNHRIRKVDATTGVISTVAGSGGIGFVGDGGAATSANLFFPYSVALDASGNLYIADQSNHRIRRVDAATGIITTVAGNGSATFAGDGGAATSASLDSPSGVAVDASGNLYIADYSNSRIRKVDAATGTITTVAGNGLLAFAGDGGAATSASLYIPTGVALDASGNLYIADQANRRIRKVDATTGIITTVAGSNSVPGYSGDGGAATSAELSNPTGVALDASGNLYIADIYNHRVREVDAATGIITTVAGNGSVTFAGDGGAATGARLHNPRGVALDANGNLYVADAGNSRIRKVDAVTGTITTKAGNGLFAFAGDGGAATSASLWGPAGVALDSSGNLYIADQHNFCVRKVDATRGIITTVAGIGLYGSAGDGGPATGARLSNASGVALDASGNLYIADYGNNRVRKVDAATGIITTVAGIGLSGFAGDGGAATGARLNEPSGVALDASGNLYIADQTNRRIRKVDAATGIISTVAGNGSFGSAGDGGAATSASLLSPTGVALDASGNLYIGDRSTHRIRKVDAVTGIITTVAGNGVRGFAGDGGAATSASLDGPTGVALDASGNLYVADFGNHRIRKVILVAARGDFNGDGRSDVLWRHHGSGGTGENYVYLMNGTAILATEGYLRTVADLDWQVAGVGDFDGDGKADILWRNSVSGENYLYPMEGTTIKPTEGYIRTVADQDWQVAGVEDFDGDGNDDILWRNSATGQNYLYPMNGLAIKATEGYLRTVTGTAWQIVGVGDFDGDGKSDILWRNSVSGENYLYPMDGTSIKPTEGYLRTVPDTTWQVQGVGDFDGDGKADIVWRNSAGGQNYLYPMDGTTIKASEGYLRTVGDSNWQIVAVGDYDGDGKGDILWRNIATGENYLYPMAGTTIKPTEGYLRAVPDMNWTVQGY